MTKIKFCGLTRECDIDYANETLPDYIGFVFAKNSRRYISPENAMKLKKKLNKSILAVGVFVDEPIENVIRLLNNNTIDIAQLHGNETNEYIDILKRSCPNPVIKAFSISSEKDIALSAESRADFVLLDSGKGGTGTKFNWDLIHDLKIQYFLAGGLDETNLRTAIEKLSPYCIDVSSGIETNGSKDLNKMKQFMKIKEFIERNEEND